MEPLRVQGASPGIPRAPKGLPGELQKGSNSLMGSKQWGSFVYGSFQRGLHGASRDVKGIAKAVLRGL